MLDKREMGNEFQIFRLTEFEDERLISALACTPTTCLLVSVFFPLSICGNLLLLLICFSFLGEEAKGRYSLPGPG